MIEKNRIAIFVVWFGEFPNSIEMWADSAENQEVDFIFITDQLQSEYCKKFQWIIMSLDELIIKIKDKLKIEINIKNAYKLCDFKPAYGHIFEDLIKHYDYWGYCDLDMVFGKLKGFLEIALENNPDKIYSRGSLSFYKNSPEINSLYTSEFLSSKGVCSYKEIFNDEKTCSFDESHGIFKIFREKNLNIFNNQSMIDITVDSIYFKPNNSKKYLVHLFIYHQGNIYNLVSDSTKNLINNYKIIDASYIHFQKRSIDFSLFDDKNAYYLINSKNVKPYKSIDEILKTSILFYDLNIYHYLKRFKNRLLTRLGFKKSNLHMYLKTYDVQ